jgi:membrane protein DedA with SNARE-associated domain
VTSFVGDHGLLAVFILMFLAGFLPAASELTMLYGGALASGAVAGHISHFGTGFDAYLAVVVVGVAGNLLGATFAWGVGYYGGHPLLEKHGRWLHATPERIDRAERWFERFGTIAVPLGFMTPFIRSFVALPAGILEWPLRRMLPLAFLGCTVFAAVVAGIGWAVGASWHQASHDLRYLDYLVVVGIVAVVAYWVMRRRRAATISSGNGDSPR